MATSELELYYERKLRIALDALDELDRLELDPKISSQERDRIREMKPSWQREYTLARTQYAGVISAQSALPLPPEPMRKRLAELSDAVEQQVNAGKGANAAVAAADRFVTIVTELQKMA